MDKQQARANLIRAVKAIQAVMEPWIKTVAYYDRVLSKDVRELYGGEMEREAFVDDMIRLIDEQLRRAWNEGMRDNGLDPTQDMTEEWESILQDMQLSELDHVEQFADDILDAAKDGDPVEPLMSRVEMWTNRYTEVVNESRLTTKPEARFKWVYGDTAHCETCAHLNGVIMTGEEWEASGYHPQQPPNDLLECGGWRCQCVLEPTDEPVTEGGIP